MTYAPRDGDRPLEQILQMADEVIRDGHLAWIKWTCPACGERCRADVPNVFNLDGYRHTERSDGTHCGAVYKGPLWGLTVALIEPGVQSPPLSQN